MELVQNSHRCLIAAGGLDVRAPAAAPCPGSRHDGRQHDSFREGIRHTHQRRASAGLANTATRLKRDPTSEHNFYRNADTGPNGITASHADSDACSDEHPGADGNANTSADTNADTSTDANTNTSADAYPDSRAHSHTHASTHADSSSGDRLAQCE